MESVHTLYYANGTIVVILRYLIGVVTMHLTTQCDTLAELLIPLPNNDGIGLTA